MKKLLLFFALWSGVASAMQSDVADLNSAKQDQVSKAVANSIVEQSSRLTSTERQQVVEQSASNVKEIVDACGNDKELLKKTLQQKIKSLLMHPVAGPLAVIFFTCLEVAFYILVTHALVQGINFVSAITISKQMLNTNWAFQRNWLLGFGFDIGWNLGLLSVYKSQYNNN